MNGTKCSANFDKSLSEGAKDLKLQTRYLSTGQCYNEMDLIVIDIDKNFFFQLKNIYHFLTFLVYTLIFGGLSQKSY